jgi:hypothetical protein
MKWISHITLITLTLLQVSCGDLFTEDPTAGPSTEFLTCEFDPDAFSYVLEEDISSDIECLGDTLDLFMNIVETDRIGYVSRDRLKTYIQNNLDDVDEDLLNIIDSIFEMSHLLMGEDRNYISKAGVDKLVEFLLFFNKNIWPITKYFKSEDTVNYARHEKERTAVLNKITLISDKLKGLYKDDRNGEIHRIDLRKIAETFFKSRPEVWSKVESLLFLKRVILGGRVDEIGHYEFLDAIQKVPKLSLIAFDLAKMDHFDFSNNQQIMMSMFLQDVDLARSSLYYAEESAEVVATIWDIFEVINKFIPELSIDISKYPNEFMEIKDILLGQGGEFFSSKEMYALFTHLYDVLDQSHFFYRVYEYFEDDLSNTERVTRDFSEFPVTNSLEQEYLDHFTMIVNNYKYVKGSFSAPFFSFDFYTNANAYFEIFVVEYVLHEVMKKYGRYNEAARGKYKYHMTLADSLVVIDKLKNLLRDQGILVVGRKGGGEKVAVAENLVLMSTLFQGQSNGCNEETVCMEIPEVAEFSLGLFTALNIKEFVLDELKRRCSTDAQGRIQVDCFRENFMGVLEAPIPEKNGMALKDYMPVLWEYLNTDFEETDRAQSVEDFVIEVEKFTRICTHYDPLNPTEDNIVPMNEQDMFGVFAGLLNIEPVMIRFDTNMNGKMDGLDTKKGEVMTAYHETFRLQIESLVSSMVGNWAVKASPIIFQFLIKHGEVPALEWQSIKKLLKFLVQFKKRGADAYRSTVAGVLTTISETSENKQKHPFKCAECLDPDNPCEPEGHW